METITHQITRLENKFLTVQNLLNRAIKQKQAKTKGVKLYAKPVTIVTPVKSKKFSWNTKGVHTWNTVKSRSLWNTGRR